MIVLQAQGYEFCLIPIIHAKKQKARCDAKPSVGEIKAAGLDGQPTQPT